MKPIDILFAFDTTGSMSACIKEVRRKVTETCTTLFKDIPNLRIGIIAFGDYCDEPRAIFKLPFSTDINGISAFVNSNTDTSGGDGDEFYEKIIQLAHSDPDFAWRADANKIFVLIGDSNPHSVGYRYGGKTYNIDWKNEVNNCIAKGIQIYGVHAMNWNGSESFYEAISRMSNGVKISLSQFQHIIPLMQAICYKQQGNDALDAYETVAVSQYGGTRAITGMFDSLRGIIRAATTATDLEVVNPSRFQLMDVDKECEIKSFVTDRGAAFKKGRGFYQFTKAETIQERKEVVLRDRVTGDMYTGDKAREMIGLRPGERATIRPTYLDKYDVFVQSTSVNRKLKPGTMFLYELDGWDRA